MVLSDTVPDLAAGWGIGSCEVAVPRFRDPGWSYEETLIVACPQNHNRLHVLRKPYERSGKTFRYVALVCVECARAYELKDLSCGSYAELQARATEQTIAPPPRKPVPSASLQKTSTKRSPTEEQQAVIDAVGAGKNLVVQAGAGTGKTSTLQMVGERLTGKKVIYVAYNRVTMLEAKARFPGNVQCSTSFSLARSVLVTYKHRLDDNQRQRGEDQARLLGINTGIEMGEKILFPRDLARIAVETVTQYCRSADTDITAAHVPFQVGIAADESQFLAEVVIPYAQRAWADIRKIDGKLKFEHDHYFKMWALTKPTLTCDVVMLDEAQDTNPVVAAVIAGQHHAQRIAVGDSCQQLYGWRGATDALDTWEADDRLSLCKSWRFGPAIAQEANRWLAVIRTPMRLTGNTQLASTLTTTARPDAILCRTNGEAVKQVMDALQKGQHPALVGGGGAIKKLAQAALELKDGRRPSHRELFAFRTWGELQDYVENDHGGRDLKPFVDLIDEHGVEKILHTVDNLVDDENHADVVISTAHRSKGREWKSVKIADDFREPKPDEDGHPGPIPREDAMLAYVAVTRAEHTLDRTGLAWIDTHAPRRPVAPQPIPTRPFIEHRRETSLFEHLQQHAGPVSEHLPRRDLSGNTPGYSVVVCRHPTWKIVTLVTSGLRFHLAPNAAQELVVTVRTDQVEMAHCLMDIIAMSLVVKQTGLPPRTLVSRSARLTTGTDIRGIVADTHPLFLPAFNTVRDTAGIEQLRLMTLQPVIGAERDLAINNGVQTLIDRWNQAATPFYDLTRLAVV